MFGELKFLMMSVQANLEGYDFESNKIKWQVRPPFVYIKSDCNESISDDFKLLEHKSTRGRKKKKVEIPKKFKSNVSFVLRRHIHRIKKKDNFTKTCLICTEHKNCEIMVKDYNMRIFNKGKIVCVGVLNEDKSDFYQCVNEIIKFLNYNEIPRVYCISDVKSTLENYQFKITQNIDLYKLKDFFILKSQELINIEYNKLYKFFAEMCMAEKYIFNIDTLIELLDQKKTARKHTVSKQSIIHILKLINLRTIYLNFTIYWQDFNHRHGDDLGVFVKYAFLKQYIIYYFKPYKLQLELLEYSLVESVIFKEVKNTLMVKKKIDNCNINIRIFGTGSINIQGSKSRETSEKAYTEICTIIKENRHKILYTPDNPPMINFMDIISIRF